jgi:hypothetical protein
VNGSFVFGFDHDGPDVFDRTIDWIESTRLENATFHILTPYPGTPLFARLESEGRLLHRDWRALRHGARGFQPKLMSSEELEAGYVRAYRRLFFPAFDVDEARRKGSWRSPLRRHVPALQEVQLALAAADPLPVHGAHLAAARGGLPSPANSAFAENCASGSSCARVVRGNCADELLLGVEAVQPAEARRGSEAIPSTSGTP